jgi:hypothetical protein
MVKMLSMKQKAKIVLNSVNAIKTLVTKSVTALGQLYTFDSANATIVNITNETIELPAHGLTSGDALMYLINGGTAIGGLATGVIYYAIVVDANNIKLATSYANALVPTPINLSSQGVGSNHTLQLITSTPINVCTNYKFNMNIPISLSNNSRIAPLSFIYNNNNPTSSTRDVGGVYCKSLTPYNVYNSEGYYKGCHLISALLDNGKYSYENTDFNMNSMPLQTDNGSWLNNGIDIFVDSKKLDDTNTDIGGCIDADSWVLSLIIYDVEEYETITDELSGKIRNYVLP